MTITSPVAQNVYVGSGSVGPFPFTFKIFAASHLQVYTTDLTGHVTALNYLTDYTIPAQAIGVNAGGSITLTNPLTAGWTITLNRVVPLEQLANLRDQGSFFPSTYEDALDYLTMISQQVEAQVVSVAAGGGVVNINQAPPFLQVGSGAVSRNPNAKLAEVAFSITDFGAVGGNATLDTAGFIAAYNAVPVGGTLIIPPLAAGVHYLINQTIGVTKSIRISGSVASIDNVTNHVNPVLEWVGGAATVMSVTGAAATGATLEGFGFDNSGSAARFLDIDGPIASVRLLSVTAVSPQVAASDCGIRLGHTANTTDILFRDVKCRGSAPIGWRLEQCSALFVSDHSSSQHHSVQNVLIGTATTAMLDAQFINGSTFEQDNNLDSVVIQRGKLVHFGSGTYFESGGTGMSIKVPSTANYCEALSVIACWFTGNGGSGAASAIDCEFVSGDLAAIGNHYTGFSMSFIKNGGPAQRIINIANIDKDDNAPSVDVGTNVIGFGNWHSNTLEVPAGLHAATTTIPGNPTNWLGFILGTITQADWIGTLESSGGLALAVNALPTLPGTDQWTQQNAAQASVLISLNGASGTPGFQVFTAVAGKAAGNLATFWGTAHFGVSADSTAKVSVGRSDSSVGLYGTTPIVQPVGWTAMTGTPTKGGFDTGSVTLPQLAQIVKALLDFLLLRGDLHT